MKTSLALIALTLFLLLCSINLTSVPSSGVAATSKISFASMPAYDFVQYPLPKGSSQPWGITSDPEGRIWFVEQQSNQIGMLDPSSMNFTEFNIPTSNSLVEEIATDASGNVWFTELTPNQLGEIRFGTSKILEYKIPPGTQNLPCGPIGVSSSSDGNVWITCEFSNQIDQFFPRNLSFESYDLPIFHSAPLNIVFDGQGNFWFTAADSDMLGYGTSSQLKNDTTNGIQEFPPINQTYPTTISLAEGISNQSNNNQEQTTQIVTSLQTPTGIAMSRNGEYLWITEHSSSSFDRYDIQSKTLVKYFTSQTHSSQFSTSLPNGIAIDANGEIWIAEHYGNKIAEFDPSTERMVEYPIPCCSSGIAGSLYLTLGKNGTVWFTEFYGNQIGELVPTNSSASIINFDTETVPMTTVDNITVPITMNLEGLLNASTKVDFDISGISLTGSLVGIRAVFDPANKTIAPNATTATDLRLWSQGISPGIYYLTISANVSDDGQDRIFSKVLKVVIAEPLDPYRNLILYGGIAGLLMSVIVVTTLFSFKRKNRNRRLNRNR